MNASVAIFRGEIDYDDKSNQPLVPDEIFEAIKRVIANKSCELIKSRNAMYVVKFSQNGPFLEQEVNSAGDWLPVYIARLEKWSSGGIKQKEMDDYDAASTTEATPVVNPEKPTSTTP